MTNFEILMPKLGESIEEATIIKWFVKVGDKVEEDDILLEVATDKVDSEIPSAVDGVIAKVLFKEDDIVPVGTTIAIINLNGETEEVGETIQQDRIEKVEKKVNTNIEKEDYKSGRFYSPLVKNISKNENISFDELENIKGSGLNERVTKNDVLNYLENRKPETVKPKVIGQNDLNNADKKPLKVYSSVNAGDEIVQMDRMRRMIADHMVNSVKVAPHVTSMVEADVTEIVFWRNRIKDEFFQREKEKISYLPVFIEAMAQAMKDYPMVNSSLDGDNIIIHKDINIGIAVALPSGSLIVPVIKKADQLNLLGLTKELNRLANAARNNKLSPDDVTGGTFSVSNFGTFKNVMGTPIINQPQVAIMAVGTIEKKPAVIETSTGDIIAIRHKMFLSLSYDHRVVDGALGGAYLRKVADYLEAFDAKQTL
ncbi:MAG: 2-oxo acid dehydrogenase subunit E2 [Bacteroidetes bacterium]|nr:MAG: 2-oxo acid dehydrogenase subunit E2 [Bacteroidota bacterium]